MEEEKVRDRRETGSGHYRTDGQRENESGDRLAEILDGEIISADSMQVYRGMDIGTAKASRAELNRVAHHLIDIRNPGDPFSVAEYQNLATQRSMMSWHAARHRSCAAGQDNISVP